MMITLALVGVFGVTVAPTTYALDTKAGINSGISAAGGSGQKDVGTFIKNIVNILLYILGAIAVIMIVIGGIKYTTSNGDSSQITSAKNTILYAVIGLIVAIMAYAIVNFVVTSLTK